MRKLRVQKSGKFLDLALKRTGQQIIFKRCVSFQNFFSILGIIIPVYKIVVNFLVHTCMDVSVKHGVQPFICHNRRSVRFFCLHFSVPFILFLKLPYHLPQLPFALLLALSIDDMLFPFAVLDTGRIFALPCVFTDL